MPAIFLALGNQLTLRRWCAGPFFPPHRPSDSSHHSLLQMHPLAQWWPSSHSPLRATDGHRTSRRMTLEAV